MDVTEHKRAEEALAYLAAIIASSGDAIVGKTLDSVITSWNEAAERMFGYTAAEAVGQRIYLIIPPERHGEEGQILERLRRGERIEHFETVRRRKDGTHIDVSLTVSLIKDSEGRIIGAAKSARDITERKRAEQRLAAQHAVTRVLAETTTLYEAIPNILQAICESLGWAMGLFWLVDRQGKVLLCEEVWHLPGVAISEFHGASRGFTFTAGVGLPGRVLATGAPAWIADVTRDDNFPRAPIAAKEGLHGACGFPIRFRRDILGVIEFFSRQIRQPDEALLAMMDAIGSQIGQFIERKRAEEANRESEARKGAILETALDGIITIDREGRITDFNPAAERIFGYRRAEAVGREIAELIIPPSLRANHRRGLRHYLATGEGPVLGRRIETTARRVDSTEFPVELAITRVPGDGPPTFTGYIRDITERRRAEAARAYLAAIVNSSDDAILGKTLEGIITSWNNGAERMFGYTAAEAVGQQICLIIPPERHGEEGQILERLRRGERIEHFETVRRRKDGTHIDVSLTVSLIKDSEGNIIGASKIARDITERKRAEEALQKAQADLAHVTRVMTMGELTSSIAHEVNQPLAALVTNANACLRWLARQPPDLDEARDCLPRIIRDGNRASEVITRIRSLVRKSSPAKERLDLGEMIQEVLAIVNLEARRHRVVMRTELDAGLPPVQGDRVQLQQVILNLVMNAIEAMREVADWPRALLIKTWPDVSSVLVVVQDSGVGLHEQNVERVFEAFYTTKAEGMGMGLSISRWIIEAHGGRLWAAANSGHGATFQFTLPSELEMGERPAASPGKAAGDSR
jgi:PAS domain S-box-containing protein